MSNRKRRFRQRAKVCRFTVEKIEYIDYKNLDLLRDYLPVTGKMLGRRVTGTAPVYQHKLTKAIKRARHMALLPFVGE